MGTVARGAKAGGGTNFNAGQVIDPAEVNVDFNTLFTEVNGFLDDTNFETGTVPGAKSLRFTEITDPAVPASNDLLVYVKDDGGGTTRLYTVDAAGANKVVTPSELLYCSSSSAATGANTTPTVLQTYTLPAGLMAVYQDIVRLTAWGTFAANGNMKTIYLTFGAVSVAGTAGGYNNAKWRMEADVVRGSATVQGAYGQMMVSGTSPTNDIVGGTETLANAITVTMAATNGTASANDITCSLFMVEFLPYQPRA